MNVPIIEEALVTNLDRDELRQCARVARRLARQAARNHGAAVEEVSGMMSAIQREIGAELAAERGGQYGVTVERSFIDGFEMSHIVAFSEVSGGAVVDQPFAAIVQTRLFAKPTAACVMVGYETTARTVLRAGDIAADIDNPDAPCLTDLIPPRVIEERVV